MVGVGRSRGVRVSSTKTNKATQKSSKSIKQNQKLRLNHSARLQMGDKRERGSADTDQMKRNVLNHTAKLVERKRIEQDLFICWLSWYTEVSHIYGANEQ